MTGGGGCTAGTGRQRLRGCELLLAMWPVKASETVLVQSGVQCTANLRARNCFERVCFPSTLLCSSSVSKPGHAVFVDFKKCVADQYSFIWMLLRIMRFVQPLTTLQFGHFMLSDWSTTPLLLANCMLPAVGLC